ncbi:MAG: heparinase II/III family protein [Paludibacter sp.]
MKTKIASFILLISFSFIHLKAAEHPKLFLTSKGVMEIKASLGKYPKFDAAVNEQKLIADKALAEEIIVPLPKDGGGGYTHEKHKNNYYAMNAAATMYQLTGDKKYAQFVVDILLKYAKMYPTLPLHPASKSEAPGKLFWQVLNDAVWLVHTANAYDCIYNYLKDNDRQFIEKNLFYPMAEFISNGNPKNYSLFNRMHNHGTWATAAVGMIAYTMGDKDLVAKALYGSNKDGKTGFIKQLDVLFSPDGYFTEGPYYQRYALWPFMTFAQVIENQQPELKIFNYREHLLLKAVNNLLQCTYNGEIFYMNDALQKTFKTQEIIYAVDIAYKNDTTNKQLLDVASQQESFVVSDAGLATVKGLARKEQFKYKSLILRDGAKGDEGGIAILRSGEDEKQTCLTFKATSHGLSHGHYDKLAIALYDNGNSILTDYGAARFLNIEPKSGGGYTLENHTWAAQTIAHNTVTIDEKSNFNGDIKVSSNYHSDIQYCSISNPKVQVISAVEKNAYHGVQMQRTTALINDVNFEFPLAIDIYKVKSDSSHSLDFPFYYKGQMISTNFDFRKNTTELKPLGKENGYQHLWLEATGKTNNPYACFTWLNGDRFYSVSTLTNEKTELMMTRLGANDPDFNLRNGPSFMIRQPNVTNHSFVSIIEPHGFYDLSLEQTTNVDSNVKDLELIRDDDEYSVVYLETKKGMKYLFATVNKDFDISKPRNIKYNNETIQFTGNYYFKEQK